jgi:hypothetical protein
MINSPTKHVLFIIYSFFPEVEGAKELLSENMTVVGTIMANRRHVPKEMTTPKNRAINSTIFAFSVQKVMLVSYCPVRSKVVLLLSTKHRGRSISSNESSKPEVIICYNQTKGGVDSVDQMVRRHSVKRQTRRWTMSLFYTMIDIANCNAFALFKELFPRSRNAAERMMFLVRMGENICKVAIQTRFLHGIQRPALQGV